jgi:transposase
MVLYKDQNFQGRKIHFTLYRLRYKVERTFAWQDTFRKLVISYDRLPEIRKGGRLLAYSMINFRTTFNTS